MPGWSAGTHGDRYLHVQRIDAWRAQSFEVCEPPDVGEEKQRVRQLVEKLPLDEGSGAALDLYLQARVARWIQEVQTAYQDHIAVIDVHYGQAQDYLEHARTELETAEAELRRVQQLRDDAQHRLTREDHR